MKQRFLSFYLLLFFSLFSIQMFAQSGPYGNEWIDYNKTYYKFKVGKNGTCRIFRSTLTAAGIPASVLGSNFILFRDGKEVPVFVSAENMSSSDYIEFYGQKASGVLDAELFQNSAAHSNDRISLFTDTACYYLTYDASSNHAHYVQANNNIPGGPLAPEPFCLNTVGFYPKTTFVPGQSLSFIPKEELTSSLFETGEGFVDGLQSISQPVSTSISAPNLVSGYPGSIHAAIIARAYDYPHKVKLLVNATQLADSSFGVSATQHYDLVVPAAQFQNVNDIRFVATPQGGPSDYDVYGISFAELEYPRNFDMTGLSELRFRLPATGSAQYLEFTNLGAARLFDINAQKYYDGNTAIAGVTRFYLEPSLITRQIIVISNGASAIPSLTPVKTILFTNYANASAQGDFVMIAPTPFMQSVSGRNYVQEYVDYRSSINGGAHKVIAADVNDLYDAFAYGYDIHPLSIKHFLKFAYDTWTKKPADVVLLGRGLFYNEYPKYLAAIGNGKYPYPLVPTYGNPGSDIDLVMFDGQTPMMRIGRVPAWSAPEIGSYLDKVKSYESAIISPAIPGLSSELWKKQVMHVAGASDPYTRDSIILPSLFNASYIIKDTLTGYKTTTIAKSEKQAVTSVNSILVDSLLRNGTNMITYFGHASAYAFDYNLPAPGTYLCNPRYPFFLALGCDASQMFTLSVQKTIAERYILTPNSGSVGFLATDNVSYTGLDIAYLNAFYKSVARDNYGGSFGTHSNTAHNWFNAPGAKLPNFNSAQLESMIYGGDPSVKQASLPKPDYHVSAEGINSVPTIISTTVDSFKLKIASYNLGKAIQDSVLVKVEHINPKNVVSTIAMYTVRGLNFSDTTVVTVPLNKVEDIGINKYRVTVDANDKYEEVSEVNNVADFELFIYSDNLIPVYPKEFAIVNRQGVTLKASTLNPFRPLGRYRMELDTTELFNSPFKQMTTITSLGGVIRWTPSITMQDSVVYYWRSAFDSSANGNYQWSSSSFVYLENGEPGWSQSHYYQYGKDNSTTMVLNADRRFRFYPIDHKLQVDNMLLGGTGNYNADGVYVRTYWDDIRVEQSSYAGVFHAFFVMVIDSSSGRVWFNDNKTPGAYNIGGSRNGLYARMFNFDDQAGRNYAAKFIDSIEDGKYIMIKNVMWKDFGAPSYVDVWKADSTSAGGLDKTLYGVLKKNGFNVIDSFNRERVFVMMRRKGDPTYPVFQEITDSNTQIISKTWIIKGKDKEGNWNSTVIGPSTNWQSLKWKTKPFDEYPENDTTTLSVIGVTKQGTETVIYPKIYGDTSLADISADTYPYIKLRWYSKDSVNTTSTQLDYWRVLYTPLPEAALNPALHFVFADSLSQGQMQTFSAAIENLTELPMDSMLVRYRIIGNDGVTRLLGDQRYRKLPGLDTLHATITFDPSIYPGKNLLFVEANPANDQPEEYHPNNLGYVPFKVSVDEHNPLLDVTFDGAHILNGDIVSAKPFIKIRLKDENQYLKLDDTALISVSLRLPNQASAQVIPFDGSVCRFIPASGGGASNEAYVEYRPSLTTDGIYQLRVTGADKTGNVAGSNSGTNAKAVYTIEFEVDNTPSITNVLNYPNPFSTATAFLFTLTGSQIPSQLKIQILSVTGKVVREITRDELGPLRIGRNITQYQWDGRDQYGQLLGNGVYLYRVVSSLNGSDLELRADSKRSVDGGFGIDKYFKNGYGKMYIMR